MASNSARVICLPNTYETWPKIKEDLVVLSSKTKTGFEAFQNALERDEEKVEVALLKKVLTKGVYVTEGQFFETLMPWIASKALEVECLFKEVEYKIKKLFMNYSGAVQLSRRQVCCLLALAFFNTFNPPGSPDYQHFTLSGFLSFPFYTSQEGKLLCLLHYFQRIQQAESKMEEEFLNVYIQVTRKQIEKDDAMKTWASCDTPLLAFESISEGMIEDASGCLQVDFANEYIGGGVLGMGNVQEEIRFVINPECLVSMLFCQVMQPLESILITGAEQFSSYSGYGGRFKFKAPFNDPNPIGEGHRRQVDIVAIDAIPFCFGGSIVQYQRHAVNRELNKAYCGFMQTTCGDDPANRKMVPVATGNWGCGAFGGDKEMKTLLQWMAASKAGRHLKYYTFNDSDFSQKQKEVTRFLLDKKVTVQQLYNILITGTVSKGNVFSYVMEAV